MSLQDNVENPFGWVEYINHVGSSFNCDSITQEGLIAGGKNWKEERRRLFFTAVDPRSEPPKEQDLPYDVNKPRLIPHRVDL